MIKRIHMQTSEGWQEKKKILVILAHPDDPEFFCGGSIARWIGQGNEVHYALFTSGDKGCDGQKNDCSNIAVTREKEQREAAKFLGVSSVSFLGFEDGYLVPDLAARKAAVRVIRQIKPDVIVSCDPTGIFLRKNYINHPDHLAAGQIVADAVFPAAGNALFFPDLLKEEGLQPHEPCEVWFSLTNQPTIKLDVTENWETKILALHRHKSQIGDFTEFDKHMRSRMVRGIFGLQRKFVEQFRRIEY